MEFHVNNIVDEEILSSNLSSSVSDKSDGSTDSESSDNTEVISGVSEPSDGLHVVVIEEVVSVVVLVELSKSVSNNNLLLGVNDNKLVVNSKS